jgi:hypothetical protein
MLVECGARLVRSEQRGAVGGEAARLVGAPEALVGDHDLGRVAGEQVGERLVLLLVGGDDRVAEWQAAAVGQQHEADAVDEAMLRLRKAEAGKARELAPPLAAAGGSWRRRSRCRR